MDAAEFLKPEMGQEGTGGNRSAGAGGNQREPPDQTRSEPVANEIITLRFESQVRRKVLVESFELFQINDQP